MGKIKTQHELRAAIIRLECQQADEGKALKEQFKTTYESIKPANIILTTLKDLGESNFVKDGFLNKAVGLGTGYLAKMVFKGSEKSPIKKLLASALVFGITNIVVKNPDIIKAMVSKIFKLFGNNATDEADEAKNSQANE